MHRGLQKCLSNPPQASDSGGGGSVRNTIAVSANRKTPAPDNRELANRKRAWSSLFSTRLQDLKDQKEAACIQEELSSVVSIFMESVPICLRRLQILHNSKLFEITTQHHQPIKIRTTGLLSLGKA